MRLDKLLASAGIGSRSDVKKIIKNGRVKVNGLITKNADCKVNENIDIIHVDDSQIKYEEFFYIMLNKPAGVVCSAHEKGQESVLKLIPEYFASELFPVGRLDKDTEGLLLLTNDGALAHELLAPGKHVVKRYFVKLKNPVKEKDFIDFENGIDIGDEKLTMPAKLISGKSTNEVYVEIMEGRFHQIKRMFEKCDNCVEYLKREKMKNLLLDHSLKPGEYRRLTENEVNDLKTK